MSERIDLAVPFEEKDEAKLFDVEWDDENRVWWTTEDRMCEGLMRWLPYAATPDEVIQSLPDYRSTEVERQHIKMLSQTCEFREWMLLMLPGGLWGAFLGDDINTPAATAVVAGDYANGCQFISSKPSETIAYMRDNRIYSGPLPLEERDWTNRTDEPEELSEVNPLMSCVGQLTIGNKTIEIQLPWACQQLVEHLEEGTPIPAMNSRLSSEVFGYLDRHTPDTVKYPLAKQLNLAEEISQKLRIPMSRSERENRAACLTFIDAHKADLTMYRAIHRDLDRGSWPMTKRINNYVKWSKARNMLSGGIPWESIAELLGVKTKATIEKYATQATEAEQETPELLTVPLFQDLIKLGMTDGNIDHAVNQMVNAETWEEFSRERQVRGILREHHACATQA